MYLEDMRWHGEPVCPHCGSISKYHYKLTQKGEFKGLYKCKDCRERFTVRIGTMFEDSNLPLKKCRFSFRQLLEKQTDKLEVVVTFLAVLELMKIGKIHLTQEETFGEMDIETIEPEGQEEDLNLEQVSDLV